MNVVEKLKMHFLRERAEDGDLAAQIEIVDIPIRCLFESKTTFLKTAPPIGPYSPRLLSHHPHMGTSILRLFIGPAGDLIG